MKYDREEAYLHEKLTGGLHPAGVDLWPAVAEHLPDAPPACFIFIHTSFLLLF